MRAHSIALELLEIAKRAEDKGVLRIRRGQSLPRGVWGAAYYDGQEQSLVVDISADCPTEWRDLALAHELVHIARGHPLMLATAVLERGGEEAVASNPQAERQVRALNIACEVWCRHLVPESRWENLPNPKPDPWGWENLAPQLGLDPAAAPPPEPLLAQLIEKLLSESEQTDEELSGAGKDSPFAEEREGAGSPTRGGDEADAIIAAASAQSAIAEAAREAGLDDVLRGISAAPQAGTGTGTGRQIQALPSLPKWGKELASVLRRLLRHACGHTEQRKLRLGDTRRHRTGDLPQDILASRIIRKRLALLLVTIDTSGSMEDKSLLEAMATVLNLAQNAALAGGLQMLVRLGNDEVYAEQLVSRGARGKIAFERLLRELAEKGGGGTDLVPMLENIPREVQACCIVSDGYIPRSIDFSKIPPAVCVVTPGGIDSWTQGAKYTVRMG